ncbi:MAG: acetyl-CoA carboxylase carboxyltransferase subunit alpha [Nitrospira sp.]|jgi:acetyl-CoA carboxylase carboxyl transferase subunit alpha|nr:acetyl-CoA carboxylase carboxyltransferase subunit alpha [Nitrospira sp.]MDH4245565.1 acetyl-CoA carboxylase carboxyltransferase subunit alpha [Nitrospira sp.]MDH4356392.1 acetyl-CoA carboxylase carboxyltransferase subunit alpha [Nitrospira sp.]MDH5318301.1 acetyl-CoA carboxylase carboxyltransferase subunit alpha [Nitrospira sp.]
MRDYLEFEKPIREIEEKIEKLSAAATSGKTSSQNDIRKLRAKLAQVEHDLYQTLTPWQRTQLARHSQRPSTLDYISELTRDFLEFHGDRVFGDDRAIVGGFARFNDRPVMIIGHQKGKTLKERMQRNFGMPNPEGYRKALRLMKMAEKFNRPILTFIDTPGAYPGIGAEERGQAEAIARNLFVMSRLTVPIISVVIGEGGSGGALALGVADRVLMLEHSVYSVISPEGCAAILWDSPEKIPDAASALKMTADDLAKLGIIDQIVPEPLGGAHRDPRAMYDQVGKALTNQLFELLDVPAEQLLTQRDQKYRKMGAVNGLLP